MVNHNLMYRKHKVQSRFIKTIKFNIELEEKEDLCETEEEEEIPEELEENNENMMLLNSLYKEISKIRKNAKRKLESFIRIKREDINELEDVYRTEFLMFIEEKYYGKKIEIN